MRIIGYLGILLSLLGISFHELGHAFAMIRYRVPISKITLFGIGPTLCTFKVSFIKRLRGIPLSFALLPLGASVMPSEAGIQRMKQLPFSQKAHIHAAGIMANFAYAGALMLIAMAIKGNLANIYALLCLSAIAIAYYSRYTFFLIYLVGIAMLVLLTNTIMVDSQAFLHETGSVITIGNTVFKESINFSSALLVAASINIGLGMFNAMPFLPLDGGRLMVDLIEIPFSPRARRVVAGAYAVTAVPFLVLVFFALRNDFNFLFG